MVEMKPLCVLDFYVDHKVQRGGYGKQLFDAMLECEKQPPAKLAYDRPSPKLIGFMAKHFGLKSFVPQSNNFVVFDEYFKTSQSPADVMRQTLDQERLNDSRRRSANPYERFQKPQQQAFGRRQDSRENLLASGQNTLGAMAGMTKKEQLQMMMSGDASRFHHNATHYSQPSKSNSFLPPRPQQNQGITNSSSYYNAF